MGAKAEIGWTRRTDEGVKLDVYAQYVGKEWRFFARERRNDQWQRIKEPQLEDWLALLDAVERMVPRRRYPPAKRDRLRQIIREKFPEADF
ncbi:MAG TPA: hypothetical protein VI454_19680 [Verrucomicrobiae bacterium]|jgi:hypothetical protein